MMVGCSSTVRNVDNNINSISREYELIDYNGILHSYKDDVNNVVFPLHNKLLTQYCREHKSWEDIRAKWSQDKMAEPGNYRFNYYVKKNKR